MKILLVHNEYGKYSGEEAVVDKMAETLRHSGWEVAQLRMSTSGLNDSLKGKIRGFISGIYSPSGVRAMRNALKREKPDVVNVHNLYPFISPAALRECKRVGVPVVMTIHNYRLICPTGLFMRDNKPCEVCLEKGNEWGCIKYNCEHSIFKSIGYAARNAVARIKRHYMDCVDVFACITDFQRQKLIQSGFPKEKILVIPNSVDITDKPSYPIGEYVAYSGRISQEKGVDMIIDVARNHPEIQFKFAGAVRDRNIVRNLPSNIELLGYLKGDQLKEFYSKARFFVMASRWYEGFPMAILEAASYGKPMIAPNHGGFTEIIGSDDDSIGILTTPSDIDSLDKAIKKLWDSPAESNKLGKAAYEKLKSQYSTDVITQKWNILLTTIIKNYNINIT
ncbi:MAG: glycosyltransferase family 4 protein [Lachnoclostridium sp.]|nr:glycosyltransferase family 4 protein [Lachnoclostridium sp.]